uniref:Uncharacterized protein n=1 Tax=viral metagenome TaxID=1070528 RepID=A0A6C0DK81_9ZZZZ
MSDASKMFMGSDKRANVLPVKDASGPGFLGPAYNPADEMLAPAAIGVKRGGELGDVLGAVKGIIYYGDMIGFGTASSRFTEGMPGLRPLGVNYYVNSGITCSNGATMWEYVRTVPDGSALGKKVKKAIEDVGLPGLRGMGPGILEDAKSALDPFPVINAVVGSGYPQCVLEKHEIGDFNGNIYNVDNVLLVDPVGIKREGGKTYQERWVQQFNGDGWPIQISYDDWQKAPKTHKDNGCIADRKATPGLPEPEFCASEGFQTYKKEKHPLHKMITLSTAAISLLVLTTFWAVQSRK